ncbi:MAG: galactose oxidase-like domain-containing protein [Beijerinckiaceae bacterium]
MLSNHSNLSTAGHALTTARGAAKIFLCLLLALGGLGAANPPFDWFKFEKDRRAPVDHGYGPGAPIGVARPKTVLGQTPVNTNARISSPKSSLSSVKAAASVPAGAATGGFFGPPFPWPLIPLHMALLPDGRVLSFGTDQYGNQSAATIYDVWTPTLGTGGGNAHTILLNSTSTDLFCSAVSLLDGTGKALITGGDLTVGGVRNYSNRKVNIFDPNQNTLTKSGKMSYPRWYNSITTLPNGDKLILGGNQSAPTLGIAGGVQTPEVFSRINGWRKLTGISIDPTEWYYPRAFVGFGGAAYVLQENGKIMRLATDAAGGAGTMADTGSRLGTGSNAYPAAMSIGPTGNPLTVLAERFGKAVQAVDISQNPPVVTSAATLNYDRKWGHATVLPDGQVLFSGGSGVGNELTDVAYQVELYNPATGTATLDASAVVPRLYHSTALLLPDGSVLTAGGGAPGPINELNAELYYPPYLYLKDGSGNPAPRPQINSAPSVLTPLILNQTFLLTVGANDTISKVRLIRAGADTHAFDAEQRLISLPYTQSGTQVTATLPAAPHLIPPGYYMLFVLNSSGVPAVAPIISIGSSLPDLVPTSLTYSSTTGAFASTVKNQGTFATPSGISIVATYLLDGVQCSMANVAGPLAVGASATLGSGVCTVSSGSHTIAAIIDNASAIIDANRSNNTLSKTIVVP